MTFQNVKVTQTPSGDGTTTIDLSYSFVAETYYSNNGTVSGEWVSAKDGIFEAALTTEPSGATITGLIPGSTWVVHVDGPVGSGGIQSILVEGVPAKPVNGVNFTVTEYTNKINFDFSTNTGIWNNGEPEQIKVVIKSLNSASTFKTVTKNLTATNPDPRTFDITDLEPGTQYEVLVYLTNEHGDAPIGDSFVVSTDDNRAAVSITRAIGLESLVSSLADSYVDICFNVGTTSNKARAGDIVRFALGDSTTLMDANSMITVVDDEGNSHVKLQSNLLTVGNHKIKLLVRRANSENVNNISDGNASNTANFNIKLKPLAPSFTVNPKNDLVNKIVFTFDAGENNGWTSKASYKAVITAADDTVKGASTDSNELAVVPGEVTLSQLKLTELSGVTLNSDVRINVKKIVDGTGVITDGSLTDIELNATAHPHFSLFYIVDPAIDSVSVSESDDPSQNYLHIDYDISAAAVAAESELKAYIRCDQEWNETDPNTASAEFSSSFTLGASLVGVDVPIDSGKSDGDDVHVLLELNNEGKKAYKAATVTLKDNEPKPPLENLYGWSDYLVNSGSHPSDTHAAFDFEFDTPAGILLDLHFEVWLKDLSSGVFKNVASDLEATKLRKGGVIIRASFEKSEIVDASGLSFGEDGYSAPSQLSFGVAQTNPNYDLTSSDFTSGFTNDQGKVTQAVASVKYHPVNVNITSVSVNPSNTLSVDVEGTNLSGLTYLITVFDSSSNANIGLGNGAAGTFSSDAETLTVTTVSPILTKSEYRLVLQVKDTDNLVVSQDTLRFTYAFAPLIATTVPLTQVIVIKNVNNSLDSGIPTDVSGQYAVNITPNGAALTTVQAMYYSDNIDASFVKVDVPVNTPSDTLNGTYTAYLDFTNKEGAILMTVNDSGMDAHHFYAPQ